MPDVIPDLTVHATDGERRLSELGGQALLLYFYPRDNTPGCTREAQDFRDRFAEFQARNCNILGVSRDSLKSHENFRSRQDLPFALISDPDEELCTALDVMRNKKLYGKEVRGIERSSFLFGADGRLRRAWRKVKVPGHVDEVLAALDEPG